MTMDIFDVVNKLNELADSFDRTGVKEVGKELRMYVTVIEEYRKQNIKKQEELSQQLLKITSRLAGLEHSRND